MATEVKIPAMGESITSGILSAWHVKDGDYVESGQTLFELETDKITSEGLAEVSGKISIKASEEEEVQIGQVVATIDESASGSAEKSAPKEEPKKEAPKASKSEPAPKVAAKADMPQSPAVKRVAAETGIDPNQVPGTGKDGRVTKGDMLKAQSNAPTTPSKATPAPHHTPEGERTTRTRMSPMRRKIAERLVSAQQTAAMLTTFNECDMSGVMALRKQYQDVFVKKYGIKLGFMSFFVKAAVHALQHVPNINAQIEGDEIIQNHYYDIGVAVSTPKGLMVPVIRNCEQSGFNQIEADIAAYAQKARDGKIGIEDLQGGVFTITNGGIFGSMLSTPILNAPQSAILGMHNIVERAVVVNGEITIRPMMYLALSYDHRIVDGKEAVTFLVKIKEAIEDPTRLLISI